MLSYDSHNRQWRSANPRRGFSVCQRIAHILDYESPRKHASSIVARKALRWKRIFLWMDQWSKTTSHKKTGFGYNATQRTSFRSWFQACQRVLPLVLILQLQWHLQDRRGIVLHLSQARLLHQPQQHQVTVRLEKERIKVKMIPLQCLCQVQMLMIERETRCLPWNQSRAHPSHPENLKKQKQKETTIERGNPLWTVTKRHGPNKRSQGMINVLNNIDCVPSNVQSSHQEALLYVFEDNKAVIKMIIKGRSVTMRRVSRTHRVALNWLFEWINLDPKIQIEYIDTKNQLADMLTKGNFTRDEWNHLLCLFNISHFSSTDCSDVMWKRTQQDSGEERVTAKSRPMMSLIARALSNLSSSTSESPEKRSYGNQDPWSAKAEIEDRTGQPVVGSDPRTAPGYYHEQFIENSVSARYSKWDDNKTWSSQGWKAVTNRWMMERGNPLWPLGERHTSPNQVSFMRRPSTMEQGNPLWTMQNFVIERCNQLWSFKEEQGHSNLSLETMKQNYNCQWNLDHS